MTDKNEQLKHNKAVEEYVCSIKSYKQSFSNAQYMTNSLDDDMAASAISLSFSVVPEFKDASKGNNSETTVTNGNREKEFLLDSQHKNDLESSILFKAKAKARPRCSR